jgi:RHS repeat-associated protein
VSALDHNNPVASCDIQTTQVDTYTFDGSGGAGVTSYIASAGFSGTQGQNQWRYQYSTNGEASFSDMTYDSANARWNGSEINCTLWAAVQHPGTSVCDSVRTWVAPSAGTVTLAANGPISLATGSGQSPGVQIRVLKNGTQIWPASGWQLLNHGGSLAFPALTLNVSSGDQLHFVLAQIGGSNQCDSTTWDPQVDFATAGSAASPLAHSAALGSGFLASQGFSTTQGQNQWRYQYSTDSETTFQDMTYNSSNAWWNGPDSLCIVSTNWQHPGSSTCDSVRTWVAPSAGTVLLTTNGPITLRTGCGSMSPQVQIRLLKNGVQIWPAVGWQAITHGQSLPFSPLTISVASGDHVQFVLAEVGGNACDTTTWDPRVTYTEGWIETTTTYDSYGNPLTTTDPDANAGNSTHVGCTVGGGTTTYSTCTAYDATFQVLPISKTNALNQTEPTGYTQTAAGGFGLWPTSTTDLNGQITTYAYDGLGRMTGRTLPGETPGVVTTSWAYTDFCAASGAQSPCLEIDQTQQLTSTTAITIRAFYDGFGRLVELRSPGPNGQDVVHYRYYDPSGRTVFESIQYFVAAYTGAPGAAAYSIPDSTQPGTSTAYDGQGRVTSTTDALSNLTKTSYSVVCGVVTGDSACYEQGLVVDPLGHQQATLGDALGRKIYDQRYTGNSPSTSHVYATTTYTYDVSANLIQILHPDGVTKTIFQFDLAGQQIGLLDPDRGSESYVSDAEGNRIQSIDARGSSGTVYSGYDGLDRQLWRSAHSDGSSPSVTYTYDSTANGNFGVGHTTGETFTNGTLSGSYSYGYDQRGQQISNTLTVGSASYPVQTTYDDATNVLTQTYPDGEVVTNSYSAQGWLTGVSTQVGSTNVTLLSNASYSGVGGAGHLITGATLDGGMYQYATGYDLLLRLTDAKYTLTSSGATLYEEQRGFDGAGNVSAETTTLPQGTDVQQFCYDEQNRVTWAGSVGTPPCTGTAITPGTLTNAQYIQSYSYDTMGRLTSGTLGSYSYGDGAHVHAVTSIGGSVYTATYDAAGDMTCRAPTTATTCTGSTPTGAQLGYDNEGRLSQWQNAPTSPKATDQFLYDGEGNRVAQQATQNSTTTTTVYVGNLEEVATTGGNSTPTTYYYVGTQRIALAVNGLFSYLATDAESSVSVAFDANGNVQASQLFSPYGTVRYSTGSMPGTYGFTGQRADPMTGLNYFNARYYDPAAGQFTSADTMLPGKGLDPWGLSRYAYVEGNPISRTDPTGHGWFDSIVSAVSHVVKAVAPVAVAALDATTGIPSMINDVKTVFSGNASTLQKIMAIGDIALNVAMDASMVVGLGEGARAAYMGVKVAAKIGEHALLDAGEHAAEHVGEHLVEDGAEHAAEDAGEHAAEDGGEDAAKACEGGGLSFTAMTLVATPGGERAIGTLRVGDIVLAYDPATGQVSAQVVQHVWINHDNDLIDLHLAVTSPSTMKGQTSAAASSPDKTTSTSSAPLTDETVHTTAKHPFLTVEQV